MVLKAEGRRPSPIPPWPMVAWFTFIMSRGVRPTWDLIPLIIFWLLSTWSKCVPFLGVVNWLSYVLTTFLAVLNFWIAPMSTVAFSFFFWCLADLTRSI